MIPRVVLCITSLLFLSSVSRMYASPYGRGLRISMNDSVYSKKHSRLSYHPITIHNNGKKDVTLASFVYTTIGESTRLCNPPSCTPPRTDTPLCVRHLTLAPGKKCYFWVHHYHIPSLIGPDYIVQHPFSITVTTTEGVSTTGTAPAVYRQFVKK